MRARATVAALVLVGTTACGRDRSAPVLPVGPTSPSRPVVHVSGTVVDVSGSPVSNAIVTGLSCGSGGTTGETRTDEVGAFTLTAEPMTAEPIGGTGCVTARKEGFLQSTRGIPNSEPVTIRMLRLRAVSGTLVEVDGGAVAGARVTGEGIETVTDANGVFRLDRVGYVLKFAADGFAGIWISVSQPEDASVGLVRIQRAIVLPGASSVRSRISADDVRYELGFDEYGAYCSPCKRIDVAPGHQVVTAQLRWDGPVPLQLWAGADGNDVFRTAIAAPGESALELRVPRGTQFLLVGFPSWPAAPVVTQPVPFELTTRQ
jgi:hypothetical protein